MARFRFYIVLGFASFIFLNCNKSSSNNNPPPVDKPTDIQIDFPNSTVIYTNGFPLVISGKIIDDNTVSTAKVEIKNKTTGVVLFQQTTAAGNIALYRFNWNWTVSGITAITPATVKITSIDFYNNQVSKELDITLAN